MPLETRNRMAVIAGIRAPGINQPLNATGVPPLRPLARSVRLGSSRPGSARTIGDLKMRRLINFSLPTPRQAIRRYPPSCPSTLPPQFR